MQKKRTFTVMAILLAVLVLGVGYALISNVTLNLTGTANIKANADFTVEYDTANGIDYSTTDTITDGENTRSVVQGTYTDATNATMTVWLDNTHRSAYAIYKVKNKSTDLSATLAASVTQISDENKNPYFSGITAAYYSDSTCNTPLGNNKLAAGATAYLKVTVTLAKSPIEDVTNASFSVTTTASPAEAD